MDWLSGLFADGLWKLVLTLAGSGWIGTKIYEFAAALVRRREQRLAALLAYVTDVRLIQESLAKFDAGEWRQEATTRLSKYAAAGRPFRFFKGTIVRSKALGSLDAHLHEFSPELILTIQRHELLVETLIERNEQLSTKDFEELDLERQIEAVAVFADSASAVRDSADALLPDLERETERLSKRALTAILRGRRK